MARPGSTPVGVLAVQGDFEAHSRALVRAGAAPEDVVLVRTPEALGRVGRLIVPGGESTTVGLLLRDYGLGEAILRRGEAGMPIWGTCMGMILLAREIHGSDQYRLGLLDAAVRRNAFGAQVHSFEAEVEFAGLEAPLRAVFIRAPVVERTGPNVEVVARYEGKIVAVRQGALLGTSFHPELTDDVRLHADFLAR